MPFLIWVNSAKENLPRTYSILNLVVCLFDFIFFFLVNSWFRASTYFLLVFSVVRLLIAIMLYLGVKERHLDKCKGWCILEAVLLVLLILTMIFATFSVVYIIFTILGIVLRTYGIWIIYNFVKALQIENGEDNTVISNFCPTPFRGIFQKNPGPPDAETTQHV